jgi:hypothetical protein
VASIDLGDTHNLDLGASGLRGGVITCDVHRNLISRIRIRTVVGFFSVQSNGASVVGKGKEEKFNFLTK